MYEKVRTFSFSTEIYNIPEGILYVCYQKNFKRCLRLPTQNNIPNGFSWTLQYNAAFSILQTRVMKRYISVLQLAAFSGNMRRKW